MGSKHSKECIQLLELSKLSPHKSVCIRLYFTSRKQDNAPHLVRGTALQQSQLQQTRLTKMGLRLPEDIV